MVHNNAEVASLNGTQVCVAIAYKDRERKIAFQGPEGGKAAKNAMKVVKKLAKKKQGVRSRNMMWEAGSA
ncbi:hypothetical protein B0A48_03925 [Cryoendolithus antarcticus]|uniref:Uncharacterized protein n=1 Tax=Cryoendolithus antarcticus TaxID=1507870 RepID=A0A1V8TGW1_9PEZI|nr:hypothetical protein B0A48_03925 [Cryoendolithus antarcticus]